MQQSRFNSNCITYRKLFCISPLTSVVGFLTMRTWQSSPKNGFQKIMSTYGCRHEGYFSIYLILINTLSPLEQHIWQILKEPLLHSTLQNLNTAVITVWIVRVIRTKLPDLLPSFALITHKFAETVKYTVLSITLLVRVILTEIEAVESNLYLAAIPKRVLLLPAVQARFTAVSRLSLTFW